MLNIVYILKVVIAYFVTFNFPFTFIFSLLVVQLFIAVKSLLGPEYNSNLPNSCLICV